jgi:outer membrane protein TolC
MKIRHTGTGHFLLQHLGVHSNFLKSHLRIASKLFALLLFLISYLNQPLSAQHVDTVSVTLSEFLELARNRSTLLKVSSQQISLAQNREDQVKSQRILPMVDLTTAHGLVPGVSGSDRTLPESQLYLDPTLRNDWESWGLFTRAEISALQPLYTWGAIGKATKAANMVVEMSIADHDKNVQSLEIRLFELYYTRLLVNELNRIADDAAKTIERAETELQKMLDEGDPDISEADMFELRIFSHEFDSQLDELRETELFLSRAWNLALGNTNSSVIYIPETRFLDPVNYLISDIEFYNSTARRMRPEIRQVSGLHSAARYGLEANRASNYPALFMGFSAAYARTPNRPRQANPFIRNSTNFETIQYGVGIRQNLNLQAIRLNNQRSELQLRQARYAMDAVDDVVMLEIADNYRSMMMSYSRMQNTRLALDVSNEWLRMEQIDYDLGFGDVRSLIDAMKKALEKELEYRQRIFEFNVNVGKLYHSSGLPVESLTVETD